MLKKVKNINSINDMLELLKYSKSKSEYKPNLKIIANDKMQTNYEYILERKYGDIHNELDDKTFKPFYTPEQMLSLGIFEGKYLNDCILEFPKEWYIKALKKNKLNPNEANENYNKFKIKSRMNLNEWIKKGWISQNIKNNPDNRGWFQWYCRYYIGRRIPDIDKIQIKRWKAFNRHYMQVKKNCSNINCRPKQRQALLQWSYNSLITS